MKKYHKNTSHHPLPPHEEHQNQHFHGFPDMGFPGFPSPHQHSIPHPQQPPPLIPLFYNKNPKPITKFKEISPINMFYHWPYRPYNDYPDSPVLQAYYDNSGVYQRPEICGYGLEIDNSCL